MAEQASPTVTALGLTKIELADIGADGTLGQYETLGLTHEGSCTMVDEDPTTQDFYCEEEDDPVVSISKRGKTTINFSVMNASPETMAKVFGGTTKDGVWEAPEKMPVIEKAARITPQLGCTFEVPRASLVAKMNGTFSKTGIFLVDIVLTVKKPKKGGRIKMTGTPVAPVSE